MKFTVDTKHHIPFGAGTSKSGKKVYIDRDITKFMKMKDGTQVNVYKALAAHEEAEDAQMRKGMHYEQAHREYGNKAEKKYVGKNWKEYDEKILKFIGKDEHMRVKTLPRDLEKKPYREEPYREEHYKL